LQFVASKLAFCLHTSTRCTRDAVLQMAFADPKCIVRSYSGHPISTLLGVTAILQKFPKQAYCSSVSIPSCRILRYRLLRCSPNFSAAAVMLPRADGKRV